MANDATRPEGVTWKHETESVKGKAVVVTGGTTGIGRAIAVLLAAQGAKVLVFGRHEQELNDAMKDLRAAAGSDGEAHGMTADQAKWEDVQRVFREADEKLGGVDILVNNAGLAAGSITEMDYPDFEYIIRTNLLGYMACAKEAVPRMEKKGKGHIVCVGSMSADSKSAGSDIYVATKTGVAGFCDSVRKALDEKNIKVTLIEPGKVGANLAGDDVDVQKQREKIDKKTMLTAEDIAECVYYCVTQPWRTELVTVEIRPHLQKF